MAATRAALTVAMIPGCTCAISCLRRFDFFAIAIAAGVNVLIYFVPDGTGFVDLWSISDPTTTYTIQNIRNRDQLICYLIFGCMFNTQNIKFIAISRKKAISEMKRQAVLKRWGKQKP